MPKIKNPTIPEHFDLFKQTCRKWIDFLGLKDWEVRFRHEDDGSSGGLGSCAVDLQGRVACIYLNKNWDGFRAPVTDRDIRDTAKHEILELLLSRMNYIAEARFVQPEEINEARHEIIRILEAVLPDA